MTKRTITTTSGIPIRENLEGGKRPVDRGPVVNKRPSRKSDGHPTPPAGYPTDKNLYADPENYKYPLDSPDRIRSAWSYIHNPSNRKGYSAEELAYIEARIKAAAKRRGIEVSDETKRMYEPSHLTVVTDDSGHAERFSLYVPFARKGKDDDRIVEGYAWVNAEVGDGWNLPRMAIESAAADYMRWGAIRVMHQPLAAGTAKAIEFDDIGCWIRARIVDDNEWVKVKEGVYKGFSIGGRPKTVRGNKIELFDWIETSLVDRPADPDAIFTLVRAHDYSTKEEVTRMPDVKKRPDVEADPEEEKKPPFPPADADGDDEEAPEQEPDGSDAEPEGEGDPFDDDAKDDAAPQSDEQKPAADAGADDADAGSDADPVASEEADKDNADNQDPDGSPDDAGIASDEANPDQADSDAAEAPDADAIPGVDTDPDAEAEGEDDPDDFSGKLGHSDVEKKLNMALESSLMLHEVIAKVMHSKLSEDQKELKIRTSIQQFADHLVQKLRGTNALAVTPDPKLDSAPQDKADALPVSEPATEVPDDKPVTEPTVAPTEDPTVEHEDEDKNAARADLPEFQRYAQIEAENANLVQRLESAEEQLAIVRGELTQAKERAAELENTPAPMTAPVRYPEALERQFKTANAGQEASTESTDVQDLRARLTRLQEALSTETNEGKRRDGVVEMFRIKSQMARLGVY